jgi:hypothetical protein
MDTANLLIGIGTILVGVASAIVAALVPFLSVRRAQQLADQSQRQRHIIDLYLRIQKDIQNYRLAFLDRHPDRIPQIDPALELRLTRQLQDCITMLNGDCLVVGLLFGHKGDEIGMRIRELGETAKVLLEPGNKPTFAECQQKMKEMIPRVTWEMKQAWYEEVPGSCAWTFMRDIDIRRDHRHDLLG